MLSCRWAKALTARVTGVTIGLFLLYAALSKVSDITETTAAFVHIIPSRPYLAEDAARALLLLELMLGMLLILGVALRWMLTVAVVMFIGFCIWLAYLMVFDVQIGCGCGVSFVISQTIGERWSGLATNFALIGLGALGILIGRQSETNSPLPRHYHCNGVGK
ncbi:MAG: DoxX family membrane protein [Phycisphaeraceae bacterium]|nr:MAG: DoxX family membrane protein [Phycisphaeraceae bacterium]